MVPIPTLDVILSSNKIDIRLLIQGVHPKKEAACMPWPHSKVAKLTTLITAKTQKLAKIPHNETITSSIPPTTNCANERIMNQLITITTLAQQKRQTLAPTL